MELVTLQCCGVALQRWSSLQCGVATMAEGVLTLRCSALKQIFLFFCFVLLLHVALREKESVALHEKDNVSEKEKERILSRIRHSPDSGPLV
jgi:hypothetical protein